MTDHPTDLKALAQNYLADAQMFQKDAAKAQQDLRYALDNNREQREQSNEFLERLVKAAHKKADEQNWCSEFDEFMESFGLPGREREYQVTVMTTLTYTTIVRARNEDEAGEMVTDQAEGEWHNGNVDINDIETLEVEEV